MLLRSLWHAISVLENQYYTKTVDLVTFTEEILIENFIFCAVSTSENEEEPI